MKEYKEISFDELFDFPAISSKITMGFINQNKGDIPVYGSRKDGKPVGFIKDNLPKKTYFKNSLSWNRNGSVGYVFYRNHKFITTDDHRPLAIKKEHQNKLDITFIRFLVQKTIFDNGFAWDDKAGPTKLKILFLQIPIKGNGDFDIDKQKEIAKRYKKIEILKNELENHLTTLKNCKINFDNDTEYKYAHTKINDILVTNIGTRLLKKDFHNKSKGLYPAYSANVYSPFSFTNKLFIDDFSIDYVLFGIDGNWMTRYNKRKEPFVPTDHCGYLYSKVEDIDMSYISYVLYLKGLELGFSRSYRASIKNMKEVEIQIPVKSDGSYDLKAQKEIAKKYKEIETKQKTISELLKRISQSTVSIL